MEFLLSSILYKHCNDAENEMHDFESKFRVPNGWFDSRHNTFDVSVHSELEWGSTIFWLLQQKTTHGLFYPTF